MRVVFFGTPEFAVPSLRALLGEGFDVLAVVTHTDRPQGRSRSRAVPAPVKVEALAEAIPVFQPERPTDPAFLGRLRELAPEVGVVVAYGHILKPELLRLPGRGMVNVHPSLLPELRGAAPVEWAIVNGLAKTGVSIMQLDEGLDSGPVLLQIPHTIEPDETGGELSAHLAEVGAQALVEALALWDQGALHPVPQDHRRATYAPKLTRATAQVRWSDPAERIARLIRGLDPKPGAWTELAGSEIKLFGARVGEQQGDPGEVLNADGRLLIMAGRGAVEVEGVQPARKPRMAAADWLRGRRIKAGQRFGRRTPRRCRGCMPSPTSGSPAARTWTRSRDSSRRAGATSSRFTRAAMPSQAWNTTSSLCVYPSTRLPVYSLTTASTSRSPRAPPASSSRAGASTPSTRAVSTRSGGSAHRSTTCARRRPRRRRAPTIV